HIKKILEKTRKDDDLMKALEKLAALRQEDIENITAMSAKGMHVYAAQGAPMGEGPDGMPMPVGPDGRPMPPQPMPGMPMPGGMPMPHHRGPGEPRPIPTVNPFLDMNVPFQKRYALVMAEKKKRMDQGELYHEMFDDVLTAVMENVNPYLIGPSGCGKTYMVQQIGELLGIECDDIGYINEEYDILGYVTAMGDYSASNFYRLYKYGGIAFCDELDNGNSKATVKLNSFLTNRVDSCYHFPGGERVMRHPSFRVIAAGNTDGNGADVNYSTREKIEESVQQRMIPIYVDYDNRVEKSILADYPEWFDFSCAFRKATTRWHEVSGVPAQGIFTTRDAYRIKQYLDNGSFTPQKVMNYEFVQTKEPEYLGFLKEELDKLIKSKTKAREVFAIFAAQVDEVRKKGKGI
ncbi:MAG: AAA family ATPase, partial [Lachnospiraceae bacterium]|nr:AAA family ATPase [Lachnospiraceae bacterium]